jgi:outer membrane protein assembly factor BamB
MMFSQRRREFLAAAGTTAVCSVSPMTARGRSRDPQWSQVNADKYNSGYLAVSTSERLDSAWSQTVPGERGIVSKPLVAGDRCFAGTADGQVVALSLSDGTQAWTASPDGNAATSVVPTPGRVYVATTDPVGGSVYGLDSNSGETVWRTDLGDDAAASKITVGAEFLSFGTRDGAVVALDIDDGDQVWRTPLPDAAGVRPTPCLADGIVYARDDAGRIYALGDDGAKRWSRSFDRLEFGLIPQAFGGPVVREDVVLTSGDVFKGDSQGQRDGEVVALDRGEGTPVWRHRFVSGVFGIVSGPDRVYVLGGHKLAALDPAEGRSVWEADVDARWIIGTKDALFVSLENDLAVYDPTDGSRRGTVRGGVLASLAGFHESMEELLPTVLSEGMLLTDTDGGRVQRFEYPNSIDNRILVGGATLAGLGGYAVYRRFQ